MFEQFLANLWAAIQPGIDSLSGTVIALIVGLLSAINAALLGG
jgi:hypothetical protein